MVTATAGACVSVSLKVGGSAADTAHECLALFSLLGNRTVFPSSRSYASSLESYFSRQEATIHPRCIVSPETAEDVSVAVGTLTRLYTHLGGDARAGCRFAVRSGGHNPWAGFANIAGGVTVDLRRLDSVRVSADRSVASVGVGSSWDMVYARLDGMGLGVNGGRVADVGVGGLSIGGGISYFGTRYGWTADTILNFEMVLANGSIVNANAGENADLLWALRGGGNNFGIVTRIDMQAFEQGPFLGGYLYHLSNIWVDEVREFVKINDPATYDEYVHMTLTWAFTADAGLVAVNQIEYTRAEENPAVFARLRSLPTLYGQVGISNTTQLSVDLRNQASDGQRIFWSTLTLLSDEAVLNATFVRFNESISAVADVRGIVSSLNLEPIPPSLYARNPDANALGFDGRTDLDRSLVIVLLSISYTNQVDDVTVETYGRALMETIEQDARALSALDSFVYLNYAAPWQDPLSSYGGDNVQRLRRIAADVDPRGAFQHQVPGGFKIFQ